MITLDDLPERVANAMNRGKQVILGWKNLQNMARRGAVGMVWHTEDLSRNSSRKVCRICADHEIPLVIYGDSQEVGEITGAPNAKVYILRVGFSGLKAITQDLAENLA